MAYSYSTKVWLESVRLPYLSSTTLNEFTTVVPLTRLEINRETISSINLLRVWRQMKNSQLMAFSTWLSFFLFLHSCLTSAHSKSHCPHSPCGNVTISYPFRLRGDPVGCGDPKLELVCEGKHAILFLHSQRLFVTDIVYQKNRWNSYGAGGILRLVYEGFRTNSSCHLPNISFGRKEDITNLLLGSTDMGYIYSNNWASFMNCTQKIQSPKYAAVPCLSGSSSTVYVVVSNDSYTISHLKTSCRFITTIPVGEHYLTPGMDVFELLQQGFQVHWYSKDFSLEGIIQTCWSQETELVHPHGKSIRSIIMSGLNFLFCTYNQNLFCTYNQNFQGNGLTNIIVIDFLNASLSLLVARIVFAPILVFAFLGYNCWRNRVQSMDAVEKFLHDQQQSLSPKRYTYNDIVAMTGHFREKLGQGGFGAVFKGYVLGRYPIAIKMLGSSKFDGEEFINEISTIGRIHHINIVQLLGFCSEGSKRALVYEYMPNGSLDKYIFTSNKNYSNNAFSFDKLDDIALGVARGINYLHHGCNMQILHFDIKPHNILLDHNFIPKISDFGLAKLYPKDCSLVSVSTARGTIGYIAPELISRSFGPISYKSDIYSFGMLLMEMAGRRRNVDLRAENSSQIYYPSWIYDRLAQAEKPSEGYLDGIRMEIDDMERKLCIVGLSCIQMNSCDRPSMSRVVEMLEGDVNNLCMPPKPFFSSSQQIFAGDPSRAISSTVLSIITENDDIREVT